MIYIHKGFVIVPNIKGRPKHEKTHENIFDALEVFGNVVEGFVVNGNFRTDDKNGEERS